MRIPQRSGEDTPTVAVALVSQRLQQLLLVISRLFQVHRAASTRMSRTAERRQQQIEALEEHLATLTSKYHIGRASRPPLPRLPGEAQPPSTIGALDMAVTEEEHTVTYAQRVQQKSNVRH